ncbi:hypothetical protein FACS1894159_06650 [Bacteroidia bacterium]|nr:hypothetical protein FACS1894159_06650 [Bacteroidia bacterium]
MRHWEIERVRQRIERSLDTPGKPEVFTLKDPGQLCEFLERNLGIVYGDNLPPTINSAHVMFALLNDRRLLASRYISLYFVRPIDIFQYIVRLPATEEFVPRFSRSN